MVDNPAPKRDQSLARDECFAVAAPQIGLAKGEGVIRRTGERFAANPVTGSASLTVPIFASPGLAESPD